MINYDFLKGTSKKVVAGGLATFLAILVNSSEVFAGRTFRDTVSCSITNVNNAKKPHSNGSKRKLIDEMARNLIFKLIRFRAIWDDYIKQGMNEKDVSYMDVYVQYRFLKEYLKNNDLEAAFGCAGYLQGVVVSLGWEHKSVRSSGDLLDNLISDGTDIVIKSNLESFADDILKRCRSLDRDDK